MSADRLHENFIHDGGDTVPPEAKRIARRLAAERRDEREALVNRDSNVTLPPASYSSVATPLGLVRHLELQIETTSRIAARAIFYSWYLALLVAIIVTSIVSLQWRCSNLCDSSACSLTSTNSWNSQECMEIHQNVTRNDDAGKFFENVSAVVQWSGQVSDVFDSKLNRFLHLFFSLATPSNMTDDSQILKLNFGFLVTNASGVLQGNVSYAVTTECRRGEPRCDLLVLPATVTITNNSFVQLILFDPPSSVVSTVKQSAIGAVYQKSTYTLVTIVMRYAFLLMALIHLCRFAWHSTGRMMYEQQWISAVISGYILYLDPLYAVNVFLNDAQPILAILEYRVPLYFVALLIAFMYALITAAMSWSSTNDADPPWYTKVFVVMFMVVVVGLDVADAGLHHFDWTAEHCPNFVCSPVGYTLFITIGLGVLTCTIWLVWLQRNIGKKSYLESRPQQLAFRLFVSLFVVLVVYLIVQSSIVYFAFRQISGLITFQVLQQVPPLMVFTVFLHIMIYAYTTTVRTGDRKSVV